MKHGGGRYRAQSLYRRCRIPHFFVISFLTITNILGPLVSDIISSCHLSLTLATVLPFSFFIAYGVMSIPPGFLLIVEYRGERLAERIARRQRRLRYLGMLALVGAGIHVSAVPAERSADPAEPYLGRWDVTLQTSERAYSSWLDIREVKGRLRVRVVGRWGHARWLPHAEIADGRISFISPKAEEGRADTDMIFEGRRSGEELVGQTSGPDGTVWT